MVHAPRHRLQISRVTFNIVLADPPWCYKDSANAGKRGAVHKYPVLSDEDLFALPVQNIAADNCLLFMWATFPKIQEALWCMAAWGFTYKTNAFTWVKRCNNGAWFMGMGRWSRSNAEVCLLGVKGKPQRRSAGVNSVIEAPRLKHSAKPPIARDRMVQLAGDVPRVELFARETCPGWHSVGNEIDGQDIRDALPALARR